MSAIRNEEDHSSTGKRKSEISIPAKRRKSNSDTEEDDCQVVQMENKCSCGLKEQLSKKEALVKDLTRLLDKEKSKYEEYVTSATKKQLKNNLTILKQKDEIDKLLKDNEELMTLVKELTDKNNTLNGKIAALELRPEAERLAKRAGAEQEQSDSSDDDDPRSKPDNQKEIAPNTDILKPQLLRKLTSKSIQSNLLRAVSIKKEAVDSTEENILPSDFLEFGGNNESEPEVTKVKAGNMELRPRSSRVPIKEEVLSDEEDEDENSDSSQDQLPKKSLPIVANKDHAKQAASSTTKPITSSVASGSSNSNSTGNGLSHATSSGKLRCQMRTHSCVKVDNFGRHSKTKPCVRQRCGFIAPTLNLLVAHQVRKHTDKPFKCYDCDHSTDYHAGLVLHELTHQEERQFKCHKCTRGFMTRYNLTTHLQKHGADMPYNCEKCDLGYETRAGLYLHTQRYHRLMFECDQCDYKTRRERSLVAHKIRHDRFGRYQTQDSD